MEQPSSPGTHAPTRAADPDAARTGKRVVLVTSLALAAWFAVRVQASLGERGRIAAERDAAAAQASGREQAKPHVFVAPTPERWSPTVRVEGSLTPLRAAELAFKAGGRLGVVRVRVGQRVDKGAVLGALESAEASAQRAAAAAQVKVAEVALANAADGSERAARVAEKGVLSESQLLQSKNGRALAEAQLEAARAQLQLAQVNLDNHTLVAPFAGLVTRAPTALGVLLGPQVPTFRVEDVETLKLVATLGPDEADLVEAGARVEVDVGGRALEGKLTVLLGALDPVTRRVPIEAELPNDPASPVRPGAFVRARVFGRREVDVLRLPGTALRPGAQDVVLVADGGVLRERRVAFSIAPDGALLVRRGLTPDARVLAAPTAETRDGEPLRVDAEPRAAGAPAAGAGAKP